jgi:hypothetical protein
VVMMVMVVVLHQLQQRLGSLSLSNVVRHQWRSEQHTSHSQPSSVHAGRNVGAGRDGAHSVFAGSVNRRPLAQTPRPAQIWHCHSSHLAAPHAFAHDRPRGTSLRHGKSATGAPRALLSRIKTT